MDDPTVKTMNSIDKLKKYSHLQKVAIQVMARQAVQMKPGHNELVNQ